MEKQPEIPNFYAHKTIFVTGCTGFIGKILLWKLLKSCPSIANIYILLRPKKDKTVVDRRNQILKSPIFEDLKATNPDAFDKVKAFQGDVGEENLGLSISDRRQLINEVSVIFYGAALLKMDSSLKDAINVNTKGLIRCLDIAVEMKKLEAFVYVSTAYCCCNESYVEEKFYTMKEDPRTIMQTVDWMPQHLLDKITPQLIAPLPNTYVFSKRLAEVLLIEFEKKLPIIVARPTIVTPSFKEPFPGWVDNLNGPVGISVAVGVGVAHSVHGYREKKVDMVPVDFVCNVLIAAPWAEVRKKSTINKISVYNVTLIENERMSWQQYVDFCTKASKRFPFKTMVWYPSFDIFRENIQMHRIEVIIYHFIPAYVIDFILTLLRQKTFMVRLQRRISQGLRLLTYFCTAEWNFQTDKMLQLSRLMSDMDKELFPFVEKNIDYETTVNETVISVKKYLLNEDCDDPSKYIWKLKLFWVLKMFTKLGLYYLLIRLFLHLVTMTTRYFPGNIEKTRFYEYA